MVKKIFMFLLLSIFLINFVSSIEFDNIKKLPTIEKGRSFDIGVGEKLKQIPYNDLWEKYPPIQIDNFFGIGETLMKGAIVKHTESCSSDCSSTIDIELKNSGVLVEDITFSKLVDNDWKYLDFKNYQILIKSNSQFEERNVYETICKQTGVSQNGTILTSCHQEVSGTELVEVPEWTPYVLGTEVPAGVYEIKIEGGKKPNTIIDWKIKTSGIWTEDWAEWGFGTNGLVAYYPLNETAGATVYDYSGNGFNGVNSGATQGVAGIGNTAYDFESSESDTINITALTNTQLDTANFTICLWFNLETSSATDMRIIEFLNSLMINGNKYLGFQSGQLKMAMGTPAFGVSYTDTNKWDFVCAVRDAQNSKSILYLNGVNVSEGAITPNNVLGNNYLTIGAGRSGDAEFYDGKLDEITIWNVTLTPSNILDLYANTGDVTLNSPSDGSTITSNLITTNSTGRVTGGATLVNVTLYDNSTGTWGARNTTAIGSAVSNPSGLTGTPDGSRTNKRGVRIAVNQNDIIRVVAKHSGATATTAYITATDCTTILATASYSGNNATFNYPVTAGTSYCIMSDSGGNAYDSVADTIAMPIIKTALNYTSGYSGGNTANTVYEIENVFTSQSVSSATQTFTNYYTTSTLWNHQYCDSDGDCGFAVSNYTFSIDTTAPVISVLSPTSLVNYAKAGGNLTLNTTITDGNLANCWFDYNGTNTTITGCSSGVLNSTSFTLTNQKNLTVYANDSVGNLNSQFVSWDYSIFENSITYTPYAYETALETISLNISHNSSTWLTSSASLFYNGTEYTGTKTGSGDNLILNASYQVPSLGGNNVSFYWDISLTNTTGTFHFLSNAYQQNISDVILVICGGAYTTPTLNFSLKEEGTNFDLNGSIEVSFDYWGGGDGDVFATYDYADLNDNKTNFQFCISPPTATFFLNGVISYYSNYNLTAYERREYFFSNYVISNATENISLFLMSTAATDIFTFTIQDQNSNPVPDAYIRIQRWDIGTGNFFTVGMIKTDDDGKGIINLRLNDAWYRYQIIYNDELIKTTDAVKESTTSRTITVDLGVVNPFDEFENIDFDLTFNNATNVSVLTFADTTGAVQEGCLRILKVSGNSTVVYYQSCVSTTSGTLTKQITENGTFVIQAVFEVEDVRDVLDELIVTIGIKEGFQVIGKYGQAISLIFIGTMATIGIAAGSIILGLILLVFALLSVYLMGWLPITSAIIWIIISMTIVIAFNLGRRR